MRGLAFDPRATRLGFDLRGIPGLEAAWLSRFPSGLGTMALPADNTPMGTWVDLSGKGRHLTQGTSANQPLWRRAGVNLLTANVATGGRANSNTSGFVAGNGAVISFDVDAIKVTPSASTSYSGSIIQSGNLTVGRPYTLTVWVTSPMGGLFNIAYISNATANNQLTLAANVKTAVSVTFTAQSGTNSIYIRSAAPASSNEFRIHEIQLELGPTATPWLPPGNAQGMQFDGVNDFLQTVALAGWPETTVYAVATVLATDLRRGLVAHIQNPAGPNGWNLYSADSNQAGKPAFVSYTGGSFVSKAGTAELTPVPALLTAQVGQATQLWQNGNAASSQISGAFTPVTSEIIEVGRYRGQAFSSGLIHDVIICSQAHDDTTRKRIESWLARYNGVTLAA